MAKVNWKGATLLAPVPPTLVSCGTLEHPNALTIAWTGVLNSQPPKTYISVRPDRYSHGLIERSGEFVVNLTTAAMVRAVDYCGVRSGRGADKLAACGLTTEPSEHLACPRIAQSPLSLECRVTGVVRLGSHDMFLADIVGVAVDDRLIDDKGRLRLERAGLLAYAHGEYFALGARLGSFGYSVKKHPARPARRRKK